MGDSALLGCMEPTRRVASEYEKTEAEFALMLASAYNEDADEAERAIMADWLAVDGDGKYVHRLNYLIAPRQNFKTWLIKCRVLFGALVKGETCAYTAHSGGRAREFYEQLCEMFGTKRGDPTAKHKWMNAKLLRVNGSKSNEAIHLVNGGAIYFTTRTENTKVGSTLDLLVFDEAQRLRESHLAALMPTAASGPLGNPQVIFCGTPPERGRTDDVFQKKRDEIVSGELVDALSLNEWCANDIDGFAPTPESVRDRALWARLNPALGRRMDESYVEGELATYGEPETFAQQRLCWFLPRSEVVGRIFERRDWDGLQVDAAPAEWQKMAVGIKFTPGGDAASVSTARLTEGGVHVEFVADMPNVDGLARLVDWCARGVGEVAQYAIDGRAVSADLKSRLVAAGIPDDAVTVATTSYYTDAVGALVNAAMAHELTHLEDEALAESALSLQKRAIGKGGAYGLDGMNPWRMDACALALWAAKTTKRDPKRKAVIWR